MISAETNPLGEIAVSIAHGLLGFPGYVRYRHVGSLNNGSQIYHILLEDSLHRVLCILILNH